MTQFAERFAESKDRLAEQLAREVTYHVNDGDDVTISATFRETGHTHEYRDHEGTDVALARMTFSPGEIEVQPGRDLVTVGSDVWTVARVLAESGVMLTVELMREVKIRHGRGYHY